MSKGLDAINIQPLNIQTAQTVLKDFPMTYYSKFDSSIQCEEGMEVSPEEQAEFFQMMADEYQAQEGFGNWSEETERQATLEQEAFEQSQEKDWLNGYSPNVDGDSYEGIAI
jgi:hypothetical protein